MTTVALNTKESTLPEALLTRYQTALEQHPKKRARELAKELSVSEGKLVACRQGINTWALKPPFQDLLAQLHSVGEVMTITRNEEAVHETTGNYAEFTFSPKTGMGLVLSDIIDLRLFMNQWKHAYCVEENGRQSIQFFNAHGLAVHKVYRTENTQEARWKDLINAFKTTSNQTPEFLAPVERQEAVSQLPDSFNREEFARDWDNLKDVHDYHTMLRRYGLTRTQALEQIGEKWAVKLSKGSVERALQLAQEQACPVMVFVGNSGCIQIFSGKVENLMVRGPWFNVLDATFNLHLNSDSIHEVWAIERPSSDGVITSIEAFNKAGESILTLFGKRKPGIPQLPLWQDIVNSIKP